MTLAQNFKYTLIAYLIAFLSPSLVIFFSKDPKVLIQANTIIYILGAVALIFINTRLTEKPLVERRKNSSWIQIISWGVIGIFITIFSQGVANLIEQSLLGTEAASANTQHIVTLAKQYPLFLLAVSVGGPIMEELVFRRAFIGWLDKYTNVWFAAVLSACLFAVAHMDGHFLVYFTMGIVLFALYEHTGSIWTSSIAHCAMNLLVVLTQMFFVP